MPIITHYGGYVPEYVLNSPFILIFIIPILILLIIRGFKNNFRLLDYIIIITFTIYVYKLIDYTIMPINIFAGKDSIYHHIPFGQQIMYDFSMSGYLSNLYQYFAWYNIIGNLLLLFPLGIYLAVFFSSKKIHRLTLNILEISIIIELLQLVMNYFYLGNRLFDLTDIILNLIGGFLGILIMKKILNNNFLPSSKILKIK